MGTEPKKGACYSTTATQFQRGLQGAGSPGSPARTENDQRTGERVWGASQSDPQVEEAPA